MLTVEATGRDLTRYFRFRLASEWNVNHRECHWRVRLEMTDRVIKEHVWAQDCENTGALHDHPKRMPHPLKPPKL